MQEFVLFEYTLNVWVWDKIVLFKWMELLCAYQFSVKILHLRQIGLSCGYF